MINYYQPYLLPFLKFAPQKLSANLKRFYYHSFEDALWDLLVNKKIPKNSNVLLPDFYCSDVLVNIEKHGFKYVLYKLNDHFQISPQQFQNYVQKYNPTVIVIFHACGITSHLLTQKKLLKQISKKALLIEDSVHRIVDFSDLKLLRENHFLIDSLRKVTPLPGSCLYGKESSLSFPQASPNFFSKYFLQSFFMFGLFRSLLTFGFLINSARVIKWSHNYLLKVHDDIIGDSLVSHGGIKFFLKLIDRIDISKIESLKAHQVEVYEKSLEKLFKKNKFYKIKISNYDKGKLHVYPLGYKNKPDIKLEDYLYKLGFVVFFKFPDSDWSKTRGVLFLPLGFHISDTDIKLLSKSLIEY